jgi:hypothetical protein
VKLTYSCLLSISAEVPYYCSLTLDTMRGQFPVVCSRLCNHILYGTEGLHDTATPHKMLCLNDSSKNNHFLFQLLHTCLSFYGFS